VCPAPRLPPAAGGATAAGPVGHRRRPDVPQARRTADEPAPAGVSTHEDQARKALGSGREDLAREALQRKSSLQTQLNDLQTQYAALQDQEEKLTIASQTLQAKIDAAGLAKTETTRPGNAPQAGPANLSCYDALYVALAEFLGVKLATLNARLARAPGPRCGFCLPPAESAPWP
jgi:hypothetical protein